MRALLLAIFTVFTLAACTSSRDPIPHGQSGECARCHLPEFQAAPDHPQKKPTTCGVCHGQASFKPAFEEHGLDHSWPLTGAHRKVDCFKCHTDSPALFEGTKRACYDCHRDEYDRAPFHATLQKTCPDCHTTKNWRQDAKWPPKPEPPKPEPTIATPPSVSAPPVPSVSVVPSASTPPKPKPPKPKPTPTPPQPTVKPPDIISHPSGH